MPVKRRPQLPVTGGERVLILSAGVGSGHNSAAAAVHQACATRTEIAEVQVLDVLQVSSALYRDVVGKGYFVLAKGLPWLLDWAYDVSDAPFWRRGPIDPWTQANSLPVIRAIKRFQPTAIVSTHFLPAQLMATLLMRGVIDAKTAVVTTDYDPQGLWLTSAFHSFNLAREEGKIELIALGLPPLLRSADLFVGKPGGLSASECMAAGLPMVLVNPIPGQEVRNGDYLLEQGAAVRCNNVTTLGWKIDQILTEPGRLQRMKSAAKSTGRPDAAADVLAGLLDGPSRPIVVTRAAQKSILSASERQLVASDLRGESALVRLTDPTDNSTVALLRAEELEDLQKRYASSEGELVLRPDQTLASIRWEGRRLIRAVLRNDDALRVRIDALPRE